MPVVNPNLTMPRVGFNAASALNVNRLNTLEGNLTKSMERVSSGIRVTRPADDVGAHAVSEKLRGSIRSISAASRNIQDGIALINVAEGALNEITDALQRTRELATQSANGTLTEIDRLNIDAEVTKLKEEINYIARSTQYNGKPLLNGRGSWGGKSGGNLQIGQDNEFNDDYIRYTIPAISTEALGVEELDFTDQHSAGAAIDVVKEAVNQISEVRADLGGIANRLEHTWTHLGRITEDSQGYESTIRDTDIAAEMINITRDQILNQYCTAMLAQANQSPETVLQLLQ